MAKSHYRPYTSNPAQLSLVPPASGNSINGMGETDFRRATPVYWRDPETLQHGKLQEWFYTQQPNNKLIADARARRTKILEI